MKFKINLTASAEADIRYFTAYEQKAIAQAIRVYLQDNANVESKRRKRLKPNELAPWELRVGKFRVFYDFEGEGLVKVIAVGHKEHNDLFIRGIKVEL